MEWYLLLGMIIGVSSYLVVTMFVTVKLLTLLGLNDVKGFAGKLILWSFYIFVLPLTPVLLIVVMIGASIEKSGEHIEAWLYDIADKIKNTIKPIEPENKI